MRSWEGWAWDMYLFLQNSTLGIGSSIYLWQARTARHHLCLAVQLVSYKVLNPYKLCPRDWATAIASSPV